MKLLQVINLLIAFFFFGQKEAKKAEVMKSRKEWGKYKKSP